jgi:pimeloyl-ACP methyl ester carboxylesterase
LPLLNLADADLNYRVSGSGPAMIFNAATAWPGWCWDDHQVPEFVRDHTVIAFDQRGTGASTARGDDFSTERLAADAIALLDHLGFERAIVAGHSNGGRVAQMIAIRYPQRVEKLVLCSAGATHNAPGIPLKMVLGLVEKGYAQYIRDGAIATGSTKAFYAANAALVDGFVDRMIQTLTPLETMLRHVQARQVSDTTSRIGEITAPTLVMAGDDETHGDTVNTHLEFAHVLAERIPNAKLVIFPGEGHFYPFYSPQTTNETIREFLGSP